MEKHILCKKFSEIDLLLIRTGKDILDLDLEDFSGSSDGCKEPLIFLDKKITKSMIRCNIAILGKGEFYIRPRKINRISL